MGIYTSADGRQTMFQTFNENQYYLQSELLRHGELDWLARNAYFGDQRNYLAMDIDDTFTPDDAWDTATHAIDYNDADALRMQTGDVDYAAQWSAENHFRMDQLFNGGGSVTFAADCADGQQTAGCDGTTDTDPLLAEFQKNDPATGKPYAGDFGWISHTYDTPYLDVGCATQNYIEAELNENTTWAAASGSGGTGGLSLTQTTDPTVALGAEDGHVFVPGNHSGFANTVPGNPATVDPPILDSDAMTGSGGALPVGWYEYAVADQYQNSSSAGQSEADIVGPLQATVAGSSATLTWQAICHAADYVVYRGYSTTSTGPFTWTELGPATGSTAGEDGAVSTPFSTTPPFVDSANASGSTLDPTSGSTTNVSGGGMSEQTFIDTGSTPACASSCPTPPTTEGAVEGGWQQNPYFAPALTAVAITAVGDDGSKPYPSPADTPFGFLGPGLNYTGAEYPADSTFAVPETSAQVVPRHPINIYYNASTDAMELDEYQTLYNNTSVCGNTTCTWSDVVNQVVSGMFGFVMANDPRPSYVHQTNIMGTPPAGSEGADGLPPSTYTPPATCTAGTPCTKGDGTLYQVLDPLLYEYNQYFNSSAPVEQLTEQAIANLLAEQQAWSASTAVTGNIENNVVTVTNSGLSAIEVPLTGTTTVGTSYAGTRSGWANVQPGTITYTAATAWPPEPTNPVIPTPPTGAAPGGPAASGGNPIPPASQPPAAHTPAPLYYVAVQVAPKAVSMKAGTATVSLKCEAKNGKAAKNHFCTGSFTLKVMGKKVSHSFKIKATKTARIVVKLPKKAVAAAASGKHRTLHASLTISTKQPNGGAEGHPRDVEHQDVSSVSKRD